MHTYNNFLNLSNRDVQGVTTHSLDVLVRSLLSDKKPEEVPIVSLSLCFVYILVLFLPRLLK